VEGVGGGLRLPFRHNEIGCVSGELLHGPQTTLQGKAGCLIAVMNDWEQLHSNTTLLKPIKHCHSLFIALQGQSGKTDLVSIAIPLWCLDSAQVQL